MLLSIFLSVFTKLRQSKIKQIFMDFKLKKLEVNIKGFNPLSLVDNGDGDSHCICWASYRWSYLPQVIAWPHNSPMYKVQGQQKDGRGTIYTDLLYSLLCLFFYVIFYLNKHIYGRYHCILYTSRIYLYIVYVHKLSLDCLVIRIL